MVKQIIHQGGSDYYEYHGNTTIELTRKSQGDAVSRDWIIFNSVEEAADYFNDYCLGLEAV